MKAGSREEYEADLAIVHQKWNVNEIWNSILPNSNKFCIPDNRSNKNHGIKKVSFRDMALKSDKLLFICYGMKVQKRKSQEEWDGYIFFILGNWYHKQTPKSLLNLLVENNLNWNICFLHLSNQSHLAPLDDGFLLFIMWAFKWVILGKRQRHFVVLEGTFYE